MMNLEWDIPNREKHTQFYICLYCHHGWDANGYLEGGSFDTYERCPECDKEQM